MDSAFEPTPAIKGIEDGISRLGMAAMNADFVGARLCLAHVREMAANAGFAGVLDAADEVATALGPAGGRPTLGLGQAIMALGRALSRSVAGGA